MLKLYGVPASQASRCLWALEELGVEYALETVRPYEDTNSPELKALNPNAKIPVLEDGELVLWESLAINLYLARKFGAPLWPDREEDQTHALQWSIWVVTEAEPHLWEMWMYRHRLHLTSATRRAPPPPRRSCVLRSSSWISILHRARGSSGVRSRWRI